MKRIRVLGALALLLTGLATVAPAPATAAGPPGAGRVVQNLDHGWRFHQGDATDAQQPGYDDSGWAPVTLPHTWNARDGEDGGNGYYRGIGWYRSTVRIPLGRLFLQFDGATLVTDVWVNGQPAGHHAGGYAAFRFDITDLVTPGRPALVAVRVNNASNPDVAPLQGDFTVFGGLTRHVWLIATGPVHVDALDHGGPGVYVRQDALSDARADLSIISRVTNDTSTARRTTVRAVVTDAHSHVVAAVSSEVGVPAGATVPVTQPATVRRPHRWNGRADPYLYQVHVQVANGDTVSIPLGLRSVAVDPARGFLLNGRPYDVHGVDLHPMRPGEGTAVSDADLDQDFGFLDELGATGIRLAHYQHPQQTYDLADERGVLVWTELPLVGSITADAAFSDNARQQLMELMRQNEQHPSVAFWGIGNEQYTSNPDVNRLLDELGTAVRSEDPSRISSYAHCCLSDTDPLTTHTDTVAYNRYYGWYVSPTSGLGPWADGLHAQVPTRPIGVSEYGAGASVVQHEEDATPAVPASTFHPEEWQAIVHEQSWRQLRARPYLFAKFVWAMFDFASDGRDEGDRPGLNDKGLVTADRTIRKDAFYWYAANWSARPLVHITSARDNPRLEPVTDVKVYANTGPVELIVNGVPLGTRTPDDHVATWAGVRLHPGANVVQARSARVTDRVIWWLDTSTGATTVDVDAGGRADHNASDGRTGTIRGPITGDRTCREGTFAYRLPVANGSYAVDLTFVEPRRTVDGTRIFDVNAQGQRVIRSLDIHHEAGTRTALHEHFTAQVTDGVLDLEFVPQLGQAVVSAISATRQ